QMLTSAGLAFETIPAHLEEDTYMGENAADLAQKLASAKALAVSSKNYDALVIGSDQVLECGGKLYTKAETSVQAHAKLIALSGKTHMLISSVSIAQKSKILWTYTD